MEEMEVQTVDEIVMDKVAVGKIAVGKVAVGKVAVEKVVVGKVAVGKVAVGKVVAEALQFAETIVALEFPVVFVPENNQISEPVLA